MTDQYEELLARKQELAEHYNTVQNDELRDRIRVLIEQIDKILAKKERSRSR